MMYSFIALFVPASGLPRRPTGGGGIGTGAIDGTPVFSFPQWTLDLASEGDEGRVEKYCVQDMQLENGPPGYQVRVSAVTVRGPAELSGADLGVRAELTLGGEEAGSGEETLLAEDILSNGTFVGSVRTEPEIWSTCVGEDGVVPLIRLRTTISLAGDGDATGTVGREDAGLEEAVSVHFKAIWRECE